MTLTPDEVALLGACAAMRALDVDDVLGPRPAMRIPSGPKARDAERKGGGHASAFKGRTSGTDSTLALNDNAR